MAGDDVWVTRNERVFQYRMDPNAQQLVGPVLTLEIGTPVFDAIAADQCLVVTTTSGQLLAFGDEATSHHIDAETDVATRASTGLGTTHSDMKLLVGGDGSPEMTQHAESRLERLSRSICADAGTSPAFCLVLGIGSGQLLDSLLADSSLRLIVIEPDSNLANRWKERWQTNCLYGERISVCVGDLQSFELPPYFAEFIATECDRSSDLEALIGTESAPAVWSQMLNCLRPYGGTFYASMTTDDPLRLKSTQRYLQRNAAGELSSLQWQVEPPDNASNEPEVNVRIVRDGPLPESDNWSHQYGNVAQTGMSFDARVKAPLGVLWFGGTSNDGILPRHGHGPTPQAAGGRLVVEGPDLLRCLDVYTGRLLWERNLPGLGLYFDTTRHFPGASEIGSNYVTLDDRVYVAYRNQLMELDAATGETTKAFQDADDALQSDLNWGYLGVYDDFLIATLGPTDVRSSRAMDTARRRAGMTDGQIALIPSYAKWRWQRKDANTLRRNSTDWKRYEFDDSNWQNDRGAVILEKLRSSLPVEPRSGFSLLRHRFDYQAWSDVKRLQLQLGEGASFQAFINGKLVAEADIGRVAPRGKPFVCDLGAPSDLALKRNNVLALIITSSAKGNVGGVESPTIQLVAIERARSTKQPQGEDVGQAALRDALISVPYASSSRRLLVFDRHTGKLLWKREAEYSFRHNTIVAGKGKVFAIDHLTEPRRRALLRRGIKIPADGTLYAFDARTGQVAWKSEGSNIFGTFLAYSPQHDILLESGSVYRDRAYDEAAKGMAARRALDGELLWRNDGLVYGGPCLLWNDQILTNGKGGFAMELRTGARTGWSYKREYGCNTALGCTNLLTFRSGAAGIYDLQSQSGTSNLGGFRSSCTNNLIPACGVLAAPDYTRTCNCAYQHQTSVAFVHRPDADLWAFGGATRLGRLGLNLGAPGDRRAAGGTLWLDVPSVGGPSPSVSVTIEPSKPEFFRLHSSQVKGSLPWVASSGIKNLRRIVIDKLPTQPHRLRLFFIEPDLPGVTRRPFHVKLQGAIWLADFSPWVAAGEVRSEVVRETLVTPDKDGRVELQFWHSGPAASDVPAEQRSLTSGDIGERAIGKPTDSTPSEGVGQLAGIELILEVEQTVDDGQNVAD